MLLLLLESPLPLPVISMEPNDRSSWEGQLRPPLKKTTKKNNNNNKQTSKKNHGSSEEQIATVILDANSAVYEQFSMSTI